MQRTTHLRIARTNPYPWELTPETRQVGKVGLARVRAVLEAKVQGPAQQELALDFSSEHDLRHPVAA